MAPPEDEQIHIHHARPEVRIVTLQADVINRVMLQDLFEALNVREIPSEKGLMNSNKHWFRLIPNSCRLGLSLIHAQSHRFTHLKITGLFKHLRRIILS